MQTAHVLGSETNSRQAGCRPHTAIEWGQSIRRRAFSSPLRLVLARPSTCLVRWAVSVFACCNYNYMNPSQSSCKIESISCYARAGRAYSSKSSRRNRQATTARSDRLRKWSLLRRSFKSSGVAQTTGKMEVSLMKIGWWETDLNCRWYTLQSQVT